MLTLFKQLIRDQYEASLCTLNASIDHCPDAAWDEKVSSLTFCQTVFHTLFYTDFYLCENDRSIKEQDFHREHQAAFRDYEELEPRPQVLLYDKPFIREYLQHCKRKASSVMETETEASLSAPAEFRGKSFSRAELHVYNIRHVQHHAAQLILRLRLDSETELQIPWFGSGWRELT